MLKEEKSLSASQEARQSVPAALGLLPSLKEVDISNLREAEQLGDLHLPTRLKHLGLHTLD